MKLIVKKSRLKGTIAIPGSKSHTIRAIAIAGLAEGNSVIGNPLISEDTASAVNCYSALGSKIDCSDSKAWKVNGTAGRISAGNYTIDVGNSGTTLRIAIGSAALSSPGTKVTMTGDSQIQSRPIGPLLRSINDLGAAARAVNGNDSAPVEISGRLMGGETTIECTTSQYLSSLLLAAPLADGDTEIDVSLLYEPDYVQMTLDWLDRQGIVYENYDMKKFKIRGRQKYNSFDFAIPADFSSATFFLCAGAVVDADITLTGLDFTDSQPDKAVFEYLKTAGADIEIDDARVHINSSAIGESVIDMNCTPDALPAMAVAAAFGTGTTKLVNVAQARSKETDRIKCMAQELRKMGAEIEELDDGLIVHSSQLHAAQLNGKSDHRIVMALALAGLGVDGITVIDTAEAINVTFPEYVKLMKKLGADMNVIKD